VPLSKTSHFKGAIQKHTNVVEMRSLEMMTKMSI